MYNLLIVDDEPYVVNWFYELFNDEIENLSSIYKAYSGEEALKILEHNKIDVVLTDICMPGIDGIELLKKIYAQWQHCRVIFLTAHNDFDYLYTANQFRDVKYILKTEDDDVIITAVQKAIKKIEENLKNDKLIEKARNQMNLALPLLQREFFEGILYGRGRIKPDNCVSELGIFLKTSKPLLLVVGRFDLSFNAFDLTEKNKYVYSLDCLVRTYMLRHMNIVQHTTSHYDVVWFIQPLVLEEYKSNSDYEDNLWNTLLLKVQNGIEMIQLSCKESLGVTISFSINSKEIRWQEIFSKFSLLKQLLDYKAGIDSGIILTEGNHPIGIKETNGPLPAIKDSYTLLAKIDSLKIFLERGEKEEFYNLLSAMIVPLSIITNKHNNHALEIYISIAGIFLSYINQWNLIQKITFEIGLYKLTSFEHHKTWKDAVEYLYKLSDILLKHQEAFKKEGNEYSILNIKSYIMQNLEKDISVAFLAETFHFNPSYLSRFFKQETGENITGFISRKKIDRAKELLTHTNLKIKDISLKLGFESQNYFARLFRKIAGITPGDYREIMNK